MTTRTPMEMSAYRMAFRRKYADPRIPQFLRDLVMQRHCQRDVRLGLPKQKRYYIKRIRRRPLASP